MSFGFLPDQSFGIIFNWLPDTFIAELNESKLYCPGLTPATSESDENIASGRFSLTEFVSSLTLIKWTPNLNLSSKSEDNFAATIFLLNV